MSLVHVRYRAYVFVCGALPEQPHVTGRSALPPPTCLACIARVDLVARQVEDEAMVSYYGSMMTANDIEEYEAIKPLRRPYYEVA